MSNTERDDPTWQLAWSWVLREHEQPLTAGALADLVQWLHADPAHRKAYDDASRLWLLAGLLPPSHEGTGSAPDDTGSEPAGG